MPSSRRILLRAIVAALTTTALLAIGILLFGDFGETEGRILGSTVLLAGYGLAALPSGVLLDQGRLYPLAAAGVGLAAAGFVLAVTSVWVVDLPDELGKGSVTVSAFAVACAQTAALAARARGGDPKSVRRLFAASVVLAAAVATMVAIGTWTGADDDAFFRVLGSLAVLDALAVALQPTLALVRPAASAFRLRVVVGSGEEFETTIEAPDLGAAAARAIREHERRGRRVVRLERRGENVGERVTKEEKR